MILALTIALIALAAALHDTRKRLAILEQQLRREAMPFRWNAPQPLVAPLREEPAPDIAPGHRDVIDEETPPLPEPAQEPELNPALIEETLAAPTPKTARPGFEDLFGRKLPIWAGGFTLLVAAALLVRYSIDAGLVSPIVRVALALLLGTALIGGAEVARRRPVLVPDARIPQALAGAGIGSLYAATLAAANLYGMIGSATAFAGLMAITALAMGLALRFGAPSALLGLVGGLATPALVQSQTPNPPLLAAYVALVVTGLTLLSRRQRWAWLGIAALVGGAGWSAVMIAIGALDSFATLCVGGLILLLALALPTLTTAPRRETSILRGISVLVGAAQLAAIVATGHFALLTWGLYGLLSTGFLWMAARTPALRAILPLPLLTALGLLACWPQPPVGAFSQVLAGIGAIFGGYALWDLRRQARLQEAAMLTAIALGGFGVTAWHFSPSDRMLGLLALAFAALPALGAGLSWICARDPHRLPFALQAMASAVLIAMAALIALPEWSAPIALASLAAALLGLATKAGNRWLSHGALYMLGGGVLALPWSGEGFAELGRLASSDPTAPTGMALLRWAAVTASAMGFAWMLAGTRRGRATQALAALLAYGTLAQIIPTQWLAVTSALMVLVLAEGLRRFSVNSASPFNGLPAMSMFAALAGLWAFPPLGMWLSATLPSLSGAPVLVTALPEPGEAMRQLLVPALLIGAALWRHGREQLPVILVTSFAWGLGVLTIMATHILFKQLFAIKDLTAFTTLGLSERTVWQALLIGAGAGVWILARRPLAGLALVGAGLAHGLAYTLALHNPLWAVQAVGPWPLVNLLAPAYAAIFAGLALLVPLAPAYRQQVARGVDLARIVIIPLLVCSLLRQIFTGSVLAFHPVGPVETIGWSLLAVGLAIAYLLWGIRKASRDWRIASLALMLAAVGKVFLLDTSGLEGLLRIGSFLALGFSLIGIGWLYSRYLRPKE
jgi:uncharacterized membrane protein